MTEITIYTNTGAIDYKLEDTCESFPVVLSESIAKGPVTVTTIEGNMLFINPLQVAAIEINLQSEDSPPVNKC